MIQIGQPGQAITVNQVKTRQPGAHRLGPDSNPGACCRTMTESRYRDRMAESRTVTVPVVVERDEDGVWCAHAQLRPGVGAHGEGDTEEAALEDLRTALTGLIEEFGIPRELSITVAA
ncbi:type II toxin-antitoxin system HicB family antitoxin [Actinoplanes sp. CA-252034]|uniref:type II toxin-antitoxin system HicB family antitoxin n=1 Tax=Actinoplanes sp. CA-252034 TaxID=3239906 RepID=UPI003D962721